MTDQQPDERLDAIVRMLESLASLDFTRRLPVGKRADLIDAVASGLNMLSEELQAAPPKNPFSDFATHDRHRSIRQHDAKQAFSVRFDAVPGWL